MNAKKIRALLIIGSIIVFTVLITVYRDFITDFASFGYIGIFFSCFLANSTIFLPAPSSTIVFTAGAIYDPLIVALVGGLGASVGEILGYLTGWTGRTTIDINNEQHEKFKGYVDTYGMGAIFFFAFLPLPLFDLVGVAAGISKMRFINFMLPCAIGKLLKMAIYSYAGAGLLPILFPLVDRFIRINN